jgi:hypothetical protein
MKIGTVLALVQVKVALVLPKEKVPTVVLAEAVILPLVLPLASLLNRQGRARRVLQGKVLMEVLVGVVTHPLVPAKVLALEVKPLLHLNHPIMDILAPALTVGAKLKHNRLPTTPKVRMTCGPIGENEWLNIVIPVNLLNSKKIRSKSSMKKS